MKGLKYAGVIVIMLLIVAMIVAFSTKEEVVEKGRWVYHPAESRGKTQADWLLSNHTFTFNNYYDPDRMSFGLLRVLNDDWIAGGSGFPMHAHQDMEIITIPLKGGLKHKDSSGGEGEIYANDVQVMTAGTGIRHSEFNASSSEAGSFLQIWVFPRQRGLEPGYREKHYNPEGRNNKWQRIVAPEGKEALTINQDAVFLRGDFRKGKKVHYDFAFPGNGVYIFMLEGSIEVLGQELQRRDGFGVWEVSEIDLTIMEDAEILLMEVPMIK